MVAEQVPDLSSYSFPLIMAADGASTPPPKRAAPGSPQSPTMERVVTHARYKADLEPYIQTMVAAVNSGDALGAVNTMKDCLVAVNRQLATIADTVNSHATALEAHHTSLYNA